MEQIIAHLQGRVDFYHWLLRIEHYVGLGLGGFKLVGHWLHVPILCLIAALILYVVAYHLWCWRERACLLDATQYAPTTHGLIEYKWYGSGPVVLVLHGTPGGSDQGGIWHQLLLAGEKFSVLAPSRFGYVGTRPHHHQPRDSASVSVSASNKRKAKRSGARSPSAGREELTLAQQADALVDLLRALDLNKVAVVGVGGGGPLAMELVRSHPEKCWGLVLLGAVTRKWQPPEVDALRNELDVVERFFFRQLHGLMMWTYYLLSVHYPAFVLRSLYDEGSSLDPKATETHTRAVVAKVGQRLALRRAARSCLPPALRSEGIERDHAIFASLPEQIVDMGRAEAVPALIVHGKADKSLPAAHAEAAHAAMGWSELYMVDEASNMLWLGQEGEVVSRKVISFLMGLTERGLADELRHFHPDNASVVATATGTASMRRKTGSKKKHKEG